MSDTHPDIHATERMGTGTNPIPPGDLSRARDSFALAMDALDDAVSEHWQVLRYSELTRVREAQRYLGDVVKGLDDA